MKIDYTERYPVALNRALMMMEAEDLEPSSALKQAGSDYGIPYGKDMEAFIVWAYRQPAFDPKPTAHKTPEFTKEMRADADRLWDRLTSEYPETYWLIIHDLYARSIVEEGAAGFREIMPADEALNAALDSDILCGSEAEHQYVNDVREAAERRYGRPTFEQWMSR